MIAAEAVQFRNGLILASYTVSIHVSCSLHKVVSYTMKRLLPILYRIEEGVLAFAILLMALLTVLNVFARSLFDNSLATTEEASQFLIILICFVGLAYGVRRGRHIRMTAIFDQLPEIPRKVMMILISLATALLLAVLAYHSVYYVWTLQVLGSFTPVLQVPLWIIYLLAPLGLILGAVHYLLAALRNVLSPGVWLSWDVPDAYEDDEDIVDGI